MKIICDKYIYDPETEANEINYFSEARETTRERLDLYPYLMENGLSEITFPKTKIDETNAVYIESGDVTLNLTNTLIGWGNLNNYTSLTEVLLTDFFGFYTNEKAIFEINIYDNSDNLLFTGVMRKYDIVFSDRADEVMSVLLRSLEKEFSNYYQNKSLIPFDQITNTSYSNLNFTGLKFSKLSWILSFNFSKVNFDFLTDTEHFVLEYIMAGKPYIYSPCTILPFGSGNTLILKSGYESFQYDNVDAYTFFNSILISMGWKWYFKNGVMQIEKRSDSSKDVYNIPFSDIISHSIENELNNVIDTVVIDDGEWYGQRADEIDDEPTAMNIYANDTNKFHYLGGKSKAVYSNSQYNNTSIPFQKLQFTTSFNGSYYTRLFNHYAFATEKPSDSTSDNLRLRYFFELNALLLTEYYYQYQLYNYDLSKTIYFKPIITSEQSSSGLELYSARPGFLYPVYFYGNGNFFKRDFQGTDNTIYFTGNPGSAMIRLNTYGSFTTAITYDSYVKSEEFKNNLRTLTTGGDTTIMNVTVNGLITDYDKLFSITDYPYANFQTKLFTYSEISFDVLNNITNLKLISIN